MVTGFPAWQAQAQQLAERRRAQSQRLKKKTQDRLEADKAGRAALKQSAPPGGLPEDFLDLEQELAAMRPLLCSCRVSGHTCNSLPPSRAPEASAI